MTMTNDAVDNPAVAKKDQRPGLPAGVDADLIGQFVEQARACGPATDGAPLSAGSTPGSPAG